MTWNELVLRVCADAGLTVVEPDRVGVMWRVPGEPDMLQEVCLERATVGDETWVVLTAEAVEQPHLAGEHALRRSAGMAIGAIVLVGDRYYVRHAAPVAAVGWQYLERAAQVVASEAVRLRRDLTDIAPSPFLTYVDL